MAINIGTAKSVGRTSNWTVIPDDRMLMQPLIDSPYNVVIDNGHKESGDKYSFSADFDTTNWALVKGYWENRTLVTVVMENGESVASMRVVVKSYTSIKYFETTHVTATLELWRC